MLHYVHRITGLLRRAACQSGQTMSEYAFVLMVISAATVALFSSFSDGVANEVSNVARLFP